MKTGFSKLLPGCERDLPTWRGKSMETMSAPKSNLPVAITPFVQSASGAPRGRALPRSTPEARGRGGVAVTEPRQIYRLLAPAEAEPATGDMSPAGRAGRAARRPRSGRQHNRALAGRYRRP